MHVQYPDDVERPTVKPPINLKGKRKRHGRKASERRKGYVTRAMIDAALENDPNASAVLDSRGNVVMLVYKRS